MTKAKINAAKNMTSKELEKYLVFFYGRRVKANEALAILKEVDGCIKEDIVNKSRKAIYVAPVDNVWNYFHTVPSFKNRILKRNIKSLQELSDEADTYLVEYFYD
ncbi:hypothetical protein [Bacillus sp. m3-13]|uniref:hypothetical protein n=1 Tax=Bacillus sp. m3-13 TaxID=406124 RepID=UPI0001E89C47|nr:hypothetical protein [Bacillus sp. m3-13]